MPEADGLKESLRAASVSADEASLSLVASRSQVTDIGVQVNTAIRAIEDAMRKMMRTLQEMKTAKELADQVIAGTSVNVDTGVLWLSQAIDSQTNDVQRLAATKSNLETLMRDVVASMQTSNEEDGQRVRGAANEFRAYANRI